MELQDVNVVGLKPLESGLDIGKNVLRDSQ